MMKTIDHSVSFIMEYMVVQTRVTISDELDETIDDDSIVQIASQNILDNYGFDPLDLCYDYELNEV